MFVLFSNLLGGIGMFLLGMTLMSDGLKSFAGDSLRKALLTFTRRPVTAFLSGILVTALIQSSSATTLMTIGFVSAGVLPFAQSVGVLMGASLGTTSTGWIISIIGLSLSVSSYALIFVAIGSATRLFIKGRGTFLGTAIAGFGLIFVGIGLLQTGMSTLTAEIDLSILPSGSYGAHFLILLIGVVLTVLMQSCSAVMATNLMALAAGAINFEQAAALAIGAAIGTTVTAGIASIGASIHAKRTALALAIFNLSTGTMAFLLMPLLLSVIGFFQSQFGLEEGAVSLAVFHSMFIFLGVTIFLPFIRPYSAFIERILPDRGIGFTRYLDKSLLSLPGVALEAVGRSLQECRDALMKVAVDRIEGNADAVTTAQISDSVDRAVIEMRKYLTQIEVPAEDQTLEARRISDVHIMDHLQRLAVAVRSQNVYPGVLRLRPWEDRLKVILESKSGDITGFATEIAAWRRTQRQAILQTAALTGSDPDGLLQELDTLQWLDQIAYHLSRIESHFVLTSEAGSDGSESHWQE